jgi:cytosine/adenosine deaminase-related metal-dependent hydrolase
MLEDLQRYLDRGITVSIGTDSYPHDMFAEMQYASMLGKLVTRNHEVADAGTVFTAATLGGAAALRRTDLGRLCPGAKADLAIVDFTNPRFGPVFDPIKALVHCGTSDLVERVIVDGVTVVDRGEVLAWDRLELLADVRASCRRVWDSFSAHHWAGRSAGEEFPRSFRAWGGDGEDRSGR